MERRCSADGWCWENPSPAGDHLRAVWGFASDDVFAVGDGGTILHFDGHVWSPMRSPTDQHMLALWGSAPDDVFAGGVDTLVHYDGTAWETLPGERWHTALWGFPTGELASVDPTGGIRLSTDGGRSWAIEDDTRRPYLASVWGPAPDRLFAVGESRTAGLFDGKAWAPLTPAPPTTEFGGSFQDVWVLSADRLFVASDEGMMEFNGSRWSTHDNPDENIMFSVWGWSGTEVVAVGDATMELRGSDWTSSETPNDVRMQSVWGADPDHVFAVGECGTILHRDDGVWTQYGSTVSSGLTDVWGFADDDIYAVGNNALHYDGSAWVEEYSGPRGLNAIWGPSPEHLFAPTSRGEVLHRTQTGWTVEATESPYPLNGVHGSGPQHVVVVGNAGAIARYDGEQWEAQESGTAEFLNGVYVAAPDDVTAVGSEGTIVHYDGNRWSPQASGTTDSLFRIWGASSTDLYALSVTSVLHYDGDRWSPIADVPELRRGNLSGMTGIVPTNSGLEFVGSAGNNPRFEGGRWSFLETGTTLHLESIWRSNSGVTYAVGECGAILRRDPA